jgi:hypothetical protein
MGTIRTSLPVKLIMPMLSAHAELFAQAEESLVERFGPVDFRSSRLPFTHTRYYEQEFGANLERQFLSFARLIAPDELAAIKVWTNGLEERLGAEGRRRINLDPGYLSMAKLVLATTKDYGHRLYIGQGIYAEVTLAYRERDFRPWPWTYADYQSAPYLEILHAVRCIYVAQIRVLRSRAL